MKNDIDSPVAVIKGFSTNITRDVMQNSNFRKVLYTGMHLQVVLMSLKPGEEIGEKIHNANDQFFRFESGQGKCIINGTEYQVMDGDVIVIPAGAKHNVINTGSAAELKMYTIYAPPHHKDGIVRSSKAEAEDFPEKFDGVTTE